MRDKIPRKLKKKVGKIPIGDYCYGSAIGEKPKKVNGRLKWTTILCPFWSKTYCSFMNIHEYAFLEDQTKICRIRDYKDVLKVKGRKGKTPEWINDKGETLKFRKDGIEITK